jgi:hypothetical protein
MRRWFRLREGVKSHHERVGTLPDRTIERRPQILRLSHVEKVGVDTEGSRRRLDLFPLRWDRGVAHVEEGRESCNCRHRFLEQGDAFRV